MGLRSDWRRSTTIELHIDEIVVTGAGAIDGDQLRAAVTKHLSRLLREHPVAAEQPRARSIKRLELGPLRLSRPVDAEVLGKQLAAQLQPLVANGSGGYWRHSQAGNRRAKQ